MSDKHYDVTLLVLIDGYGKEVTNRVMAKDEKEAVTLAICDEVHNASDLEVEEQVSQCYDNQVAVMVEDSEFNYRVESVIELKPVKIDYNGSEASVLVPVNADHLSTTTKLKYFASV